MSAAMIGFFLGMPFGACVAVIAVALVIGGRDE